MALINYLEKQKQERLDLINKVDEVNNQIEELKKSIESIDCDKLKEEIAEIEGYIDEITVKEEPVIDDVLVDTEEEHTPVADVIKGGI